MQHQSRFLYSVRCEGPRQVAHTARVARVASDRGPLRCKRSSSSPGQSNPVAMAARVERADRPRSPVALCKQIRHSRKAVFLISEERPLLLPRRISLLRRAARPVSLERGEGAVGTLRRAGRVVAVPQYHRNGTAVHGGVKRFIVRPLTGRPCL